jgi:hydrogenase expression/formation protein HypE
MSEMPLPVGKLPPALLAHLMARAPVADPRVRVGPGPGLDCAVVDLGDRLLVFKSDPITFATEEIGWYLVQVNANDLATTGATPRWLLLTMLLPEAATTPALAERWAEQVYDACRATGIDVIGGHTEVTYGLARPILAGTLIGEAEPGRLVTPRGAQPGDRLLLTKGVPIEATALLAREFPQRLAGFLSPDEVAEAQAYLTRPGISVLRDAALAMQAGQVTAMHDPTEGGLAGALWELAEACGHALWIEPSRVPLPPLAARVCGVFGVDPLAAIASGALLIAAPPPEAAKICTALASAAIACAEIGAVEQGAAAVWQGRPELGRPLARPARDEVARMFAGVSPGAA